MDDLQAEIARLRAELEAVKRRLPPEPAAPPPAPATSRRIWLCEAALGAVGAIAGIAAARPARAGTTNDGQPLVIDQENVTAGSTQLVYGENPGQYTYAFGVQSFGPVAVNPSGALFANNDGTFSYAVVGYDGSSAGSSAVGGVSGSSLNFSGVVGTTQSTATNAAGVMAYGPKLGLKASTADSAEQNVAVWASAPYPATALAVDGRLRLTEAGLLTVPAGHTTAAASFKGSIDTKTAIGSAVIQGTPATYVVTGVGLTSKVLISGPEVVVRITLNAAAPAGGLKVGWFIIHAIGDVLG